MPAEPERCGHGESQFRFGRSVRGDIEVAFLVFDFIIDGGRYDAFVERQDRSDRLDAARRAHLETVTIIHGKGTGALRKAVQAYLRRDKTVKSFRLGNYGEGESGVTVVEFK